MHRNFLKGIVDPVFNRWLVKLPEDSKPKKQHPDNFGTEVLKVLLSPQLEERTFSPLKSTLAGKTIWEGITFKHCRYNFQSLCQKLGIEICDPSSFYYVRDAFLRLRDGSVAYFKGSPNLEKAMALVHSSNLYLDKTPATRTRNQLFNHWSGFSGNALEKIQLDLSKFFSQALPLAHAYLEGGNVFSLENSHGEEIIIIGEDHLWQTFMLLELDGIDWGGKANLLNISFDDTVLSLSQNLSLDEISKYAQEMYSMGLLNQDGKTGILEEKDQLNLLLAKFFLPGKEGRTITEDERGWFRTLAEEAKIVKSFNLNSEELEKIRVTVAKYLKKIDITKELIARDLKINSNNLYFISQVNYHLDAFLAPAPQGSIFINNYAFWAELLETIKCRKDELRLSEEDQALLEGYIQTSRKLDRELGSLFSLASSQLRAAGLNVIPMPGHLLFEPKDMYEKFPMPSEGICINFVNAFSGYSTAITAPYYITYGLNAGDQIGQLCMTIFSLFLEHYISDIQVFFIGHDPENILDFSEGLDFWNRIETQTGIHCMTFPLS